MLRRLFTLLSAISLVLCVATCVLWVRSYWRWEYLRFRPSLQQGFSAISSDGAVQWKSVRYVSRSLFAEDDRAGIVLTSIDPHETESGTREAFQWAMESEPLVYDEAWSANPPWLRAFAAGAGPGSYPGLRAGPPQPGWRPARSSSGRRWTPSAGRCPEPRRSGPGWTFRSVGSARSRPFCPSRRRLRPS